MSTHARRSQLLRRIGTCAPTTQHGDVPERPSARAQRRLRFAHSTSLSLACAWLCGCGGAGELTGPVPNPDGALFVSDVYPLLLRDCAFSTCHGAEDRFFQVFGPGRNRLDPTLTKPDDPLVLAEVLHSYDRARSMLATSDEPDRVLLLLKPLELQAGGQGHKGVDDFGRNLFASTADPGYALLSRWSRTSGAAPTRAQVDAAAVAAAASVEQDAP